MTAQSFGYANRYGYSDVEPFEVVRHISEQTLEIRAMNSERDPTWKAEWLPGGFAGHCVNQREQRWNISSNEEAPVIRIRLSMRKGRRAGWYDKHGNYYRMDTSPRRFYDYNF